MKKSSKLDKEIWKKNQKIINIINEKTFQLRLKTEKEKPKVYGEKKDLVRIKCNFNSQQDQTAND